MRICIEGGPLLYLASLNDPLAASQPGKRNQALGEINMKQPLIKKPTATKTTISHPRAKNRNI